MADITPTMIKELREMTGVGMTQCKKALQESGGSISDAVTYLRKAGLASAAKKEGREAKEGKIGIAENDQAIAMVEVNAETDFVANNARFLEFLDNVAEEVLHTNPTSLEAFLAQQFSKDSAMTIEEYRATIVQTIGENIQIKRIMRAEKGADKSIGIYSHMNGSIVTLVEIDGNNQEENLAKDVAMHVAAAAPDFVSEDSVPKEIIEREKEIGRSQHQGKPEQILEKILGGMVNKYLDQVCLNRQNYVKDDSMTVGQFIEKRAKEVKKSLSVVRFVRWSVGE